mmetsp:Transcript_15610/g.33847  ORF Transcript_15610/g.33847 Transcript_15610/m.33847 type:complete len:252 (+) Transcript_15610:221-976(+)|eukprot:CAMPEP_0202912748 /NCGR_PEP_ID=MMETSP1392-20130828/58561_1 /ASSEMBLY_ACC=CAM_ASM_000868 /TAXON_ID=225041 /ORGANISM="Chlamydomonas chlamydogama, Strain SAG 11-48b" /LENGTH=251 /DNA_ID=CAMNT_0049603763 /DNA_START=203 /DNA_END=958 /DNA_ORIENTATION=+
MSSAAKKGLAVSTRYMLTKLATASEEFFSQLLNPRTHQALVAAKGPQEQAVGGALSHAVLKFKESYNTRLTTTMYIAGTAMCPTLNRKALKDKAALEKLVVRLLPRATARTVLVGDVVAFNSPLGQTTDEQHIMVRRVAAVEGTVMESSESEDDAFAIPKGHCWVLADNADLKPPDVIDSRTFGHIPMANIVGRVIYAASSRAEHGLVANNALSLEVDAPVLEAEIDEDALFPEEEPAGQSKEGTTEANEK